MRVRVCECLVSEYYYDADSTFYHLYTHVVHKSILSIPFVDDANNCSHSALTKRSLIFEADSCSISNNYMLYIVATYTHSVCYQTACA